MTVCKLAGLPVAFANRYPYLPHLLRDYLTEEPPLLTLAATDREIAAEATGGRPTEEALPAPPAMSRLEPLALYRKLAEALPRFNGFFLHAVLLSAHGEGIAITAPSGTGKTTHARLWCDLLGDACEIINGDKPLLRRAEGDGFLGYGTPFCGKERYGRNASVPVRTLLLLERGEEDRLEPITPSEAFPALFAATLAPKSSEALSRLLPLLSEFLGTVRLYRATVTPRPSAVEVAYRTLFSKEERL